MDSARDDTKEHDQRKKRIWGRLIFFITSVMMVSHILVIQDASAETARISPRPPESVPLPQFSHWKSQMTQFGEKHYRQFLQYRAAIEEEKKKDPSYRELTEKDGPYNHALGGMYYDFPHVLYQIGEYTGEREKWFARGNEAVQFFRDRYVVPNNGRIPGYWLFSDGLTDHYLHTQDPKSKEALLLLSQNAAYASDTTPSSEKTQSFRRSREIAYAIITYLNAERVGEPRRARMAKYVDEALGHLQQWTGKSRYIRADSEEEFCDSFMMGLTARSLIRYQERTGDSRILPALEKALDWLWVKSWLPEKHAFKYADQPHETGKEEAAPDLNLLIAPAYGWLYFKTGDSKWKERGDAIFAGGVQDAWLEGAKQFNQNYFWSFEYVKWRTSPSS